MTSWEVASLRKRMAKWFPNEWEQNMWLSLPNALLDGRNGWDCRYVEVREALNTLDQMETRA